LGQRLGPRRARLARCRAVDRNEARAEAFDAGIILVAVRLVDRALPPELGLLRQHRDAVRLHRAVAAALADALVDEDAARRIGHDAALAAPALLGRAGLLVEQHRDALPIAQLALHGVAVVAVRDDVHPRP